MSKFSVKKPYTILVMVLVIIMLGVVSVTRMQLDLLPEFSLPYLLVITTYPGASPERVEASVSKPLESALGTVTGVENVVSHSYENYSMIQLEFADGTDMDAVLVKVSTAIDTVEEMFPEECGTPSIMELSMDMMASQYLAVAYDGMEIDQLSTFVRNNITPEFERQNGVASTTTLGLVDKTVQIELNEEKVNELNDKILGIADDAFEEAMGDLDDARQQLEDSQQTLDDSRNDLYEAQQELDDAQQQLIDGQQELDDSITELANSQAELDQARIDLENGKTELEEQQQLTYEQLAEASQALEGLETYKAQLVAQQATLAALDAAIGQIQEKMSAAGGMSLDTLKTQKQGLETMKTTVGGLITSITSSGNPNDASTFATGLQANPETQAMGDIIAGAIALDSAPGSSGATNTLDALAGVQTQIGTTLTQLDSGITALEQANSTLKTFQDQKTTLQIEIAVTEGIIQAYQDKLNEMGIDYTDIEVAKLTAASAFGSASAQLAAGEAQINGAQTQLDNAWDQINSAQEQIDDGWDQLADGQQQIYDGWDQLADGQDKIDEGWESYYDGLVQFDKQRREALRSANADQLLTLSTLAGIIYAQNFEMPAGYIDDAEDNSWLLKVGENYESLEELENLVLCNIEDVGDVKLSDVADITIIDNSDVIFTKLDGKDAVILSIFKSSTTGTNEVSRICNKTIDELTAKYDGLQILVLTDQGDYISIIVKNVVQNMVIGAALAIVILAIFLKDVMPTIVVAISIPLSVLTSLVAMYFSGISLNMMSLSGMALGIGMLVDNSIVVIENIYRLRGRGVEAPRAAVQGTNQVAGAVIASTLTTVCVFFPMVYTSGMTRELLLPMSLTIIFTLLASLLIAMTVVPASASTLLRKGSTKEHPWFDKIQDVYGEALRFCLKVKILPLALAIGLLAFSIYEVLNMGIVMIPEMTSNEMQASATFDEEIDREVAYEQMNTFLARAAEIEGIGSVGAFAGNDSSLLMSTGADDSYTNYSIMITAADENAGSEEINRMVSELYAAAADLQMELTVSTGMGDLGSLLGSGVSISIYGKDVDTLLQISNDIVGIVQSVEGFEEVSNGQEEADQVLHLNVDKGYAMAKGLSVAQIFQEITTKMTTSADAVTISLEGSDMDIQIVNNMEPLTYENLMDYTIAIQEKDEDGDTVTRDVPLSELAELTIEDGVTSINRENQTRYITVTADVADGYNATLLSRQLEPLIDSYETPDGYNVEIGGESEAVNEMITQMSLLIIMGLAFIYFVMVAQFQSLLSPFIVLFTVPLAFTGGLLALWLTGENLSVISLMGLVVLLGTVVNNGIVFVDYTNQLRIGGMERRDALVATGKTRMRPILMTAMTTILAEASMIFGDDMASQMGRGMALVIAGGLAYATLMTLFIIPVMYDILFKKPPLNIDTGSEDLDDVPDDAAEFMQNMLKNMNENQADNAESEEPEANDNNIQVQTENVMPAKPAVSEPVQPAMTESVDEEAVPVQPSPIATSQPVANTYVAPSEPTANTYTAPVQPTAYTPVANQQAPANANVYAAPTPVQNSYNGLSVNMPVVPEGQRISDIGRNQ